MQISVSINQITAPAAPANIAGGAGAVVVDDAETNDSVVFAPVDAVSISEAGRRASEQPRQNVVEPVTARGKNDTEATDNKARENAGAGVRGDDSVEASDKERNTDQDKADIAQEQRRNQEESEQKQQQADLAVIRQLKARDREVKAHEAAHAAVGGDLAGAPTFSYERGPDGVRYAVGGEVAINVGKVANDPQATLEKMTRVQRAALAPAEPSAQDRQVAAQAAQIAAEARAEIAIERRSTSESADQAADETREKVREEIKEAKERREKALEEQQKEDGGKAVSAADLFAEENARSRRINQALLEITLPVSNPSGALVNATA